MLRPLYHFAAFYRPVFSTFPVRIQQKTVYKIEEAGYFCERNFRSTQKISTGKKLGADKDKIEDKDRYVHIANHNLLHFFCTSKLSSWKEYNLSHVYMDLSVSDLSYSFILIF